MMRRTSRWTISTSRSWTVSARSSSGSTRCPRACPSGSGSRSRCAALESEVARLVSEEDPRLVGARGTEQSRTVTFESASLSIIIRIEENKNGSVRIDGWLAPPQPREIEMQTPAETLSVSSDDQGRFAFAEVPQGAARLVVVGAAARDQGDRRAVGGDPGARALTRGGRSPRRPGRARRCAHCRGPGVGGAPAGRAGGSVRAPGGGARHLRAGLLLLGWEESQSPAGGSRRSTGPSPPGC